MSSNEAPRFESEGHRHDTYIGHLWNVVGANNMPAIAYVARELQLARQELFTLQQLPSGDDSELFQSFDGFSISLPRSPRKVVVDKRSIFLDEFQIRIRDRIQQLIRDAVKVLEEKRVTAEKVVPRKRKPAFSYIIQPGASTERVVESQTEYAIRHMMHTRAILESRLYDWAMGQDPEFGEMKVLGKKVRNEWKSVMQKRN